MAGLSTPDGKAVDVAPLSSDGADWAQTQAAQARAADAKPAAPAPPKKDPEAPYGRTQDGKPKRGPGGRPAKTPPAEKPRVTAQAPGQPPKDFTAELAPMADAIWSMMAMAPVPPVKAQAALFRAHQAGLVNAANVAAQNNAYVRRAIENTEKGTWVMVVAMAVIPFAQQSISLWRNPGQVTGDGVPVVELLASQTQRELETLAAAHAQAQQAA